MLFYFEARLGRFEYTQHNTVERSFLLLVIFGKLTTPEGTSDYVQHP